MAPVIRSTAFLSDFGAWRHGSMEGNGKPFDVVGSANGDNGTAYDVVDMGYDTLRDVAVGERR